MVAEPFEIALSSGWMVHSPIEKCKSAGIEPSVALQSSQANPIYFNSISSLRKSSEIPQQAVKTSLMLESYVLPVR
jgi:hypothetical protein